MNDLPSAFMPEYWLNGVLPHRFHHVDLRRDQGLLLQVIGNTCAIAANGCNISYMTE